MFLALLSSKEFLIICWEVFKRVLQLRNLTVPERHSRNCQETPGAYMGSVTDTVLPGRKLKTDKSLVGQLYWEMRVFTDWPPIWRDAQSWWWLPSVCARRPPVWLVCRHWARPAWLVPSPLHNPNSIHSSGTEAWCAGNLASPPLCSELKGTEVSVGVAG